MEIAQIILAYLKAVLSWPVVLFAAVIFLSIKFREAISAWLRNLKIEGHGYVFSGQKEHLESEKYDQNQPSLPQEKAKAEETPTTRDDGTAGQLANQWRANAYLWEYRYLNYFLVPNTKRILTWLYEQKNPVTVSFADAFWLPIIPAPAERLAILTALTQHYLVHNNQGFIQITPKGREYVEFSGLAGASSTGAPSLQ